MFNSDVFLTSKIFRRKTTPNSPQNETITQTHTEQPHKTTQQLINTYSKLLSYVQEVGASFRASGIVLSLFSFSLFNFFVVKFLLSYLSLLSPLSQKEILKLYKDLLREAEKKPQNSHLIKARIRNTFQVSGRKKEEEREEGRGEEEKKSLVIF